MCRFKIQELSVEVSAYCPKKGERNGSEGWSLRSLQTQDDVGRSNLSKGVYKVLKELHVERAFAPHVVPASANVININMLIESINLGGNVVLYRNSSVPADGVFLGTGHAFVMSSAGCPVIVAKAGRQMIVAHAGRDSLIDRGLVLGKPTRKLSSIVYAIMEAFSERGANADETSMCMLFSIPSSKFEHRFDHPEYGTYNRALSDFIENRWPSGIRKNDNGVFLDLENIFLEQTREVGIHQNAWVDHSLAEHEHKDLAHTRDGKDPRRRNLIVVKRLNS